MAFCKSIENTFRDTGRDLWQKIEEPSKENLRATVESLREQLPVAKQTLKDTEHKLSERWTVSETFGQGDTSALTEHLVNALTPFPAQQKIQSDTLENLVLIQRGGFGDIYRGWSRTWNLPIALKIIRGAERDTVKELKKEAAMMQLARFPHVLRLLGLYENKEGDCVEYGLVMEYMPNGSLYTLIENVTPVPWALRFQILHQVALGMNYLHSLNRPLLHLDLKPKNVLLDKSLDVQLADFGLSKVSSDTSSRGGNSAGTPEYMPPEAFPDEYDLKSYKKKPFDVYSYGILIWAVLAEEEPYKGTDRNYIGFRVKKDDRPDLKKLDSLRDVKMVSEVKALMKQCWREKPDDRPDFKVCAEETKQMNEEYKNDITNAIRSTQDRLKEISTRGSETTNTSTLPEDTKPSFSFSEMSSLRNNLAAPTLEPSAVTPPSQPGVVNPGMPTVTAEERVTASESKTHFLKNRRPDIINAITDVQPIVDHLKQDGIFSREEHQNVLAKATLAEQSRVMMGYIVKKGEESCNRFYQLLKEAYPDLVRS